MFSASDCRSRKPAMARSSFTERAATYGGHTYSGNYFGGTRVEDGTLTVMNSAALPAVSTLLVDGGATVDANGVNSAIRGVIVNGGTIRDGTGGAVITVGGLIELFSAQFRQTFRAPRRF